MLTADFEIKSYIILLILTWYFMFKYNSNRVNRISLDELLSTHLSTLLFDHPIKNMKDFIKAIYYVAFLSCLSDLVPIMICLKILLSDHCIFALILMKWMCSNFKHYACYIYYLPFFRMIRLQSFKRSVPPV